MSNSLSNRTSHTVSGSPYASSTSTNTKFNNMLNKVPEITLVFWLIKMMSTTVGETAADYLTFNYKLGLHISTDDRGASRL